MMKEQIYFDYAATTPTDPQVADAMQPYFFTKFGNASSPHSLGREAQKALEDSREILAKFLGVDAEEIIFTSGATESNNHAVLGVARRLKEKGRHLLVAKIEHHSVLEPMEYLRQEGFQITYLNVDKNGIVDIEQIEKAITAKTILIAVMHASNEVGTIQPVAQIGKIAKERNICFLVDAVQTVGHVPLSVKEMQADALSLSAHKFYGPKGIGALYIRKGAKLLPYLLGGDQEKNRRASTQNVAGAVGLARAIQICREKMTDEIAQQTRLRDRLIDGIQKKIDGAFLNGHPSQRLPNNVHFSFKGVQGEALLMSLDMVGIAASMGSACTSGALEPSHVLRAMGLPDHLALGSLRISIGRWTTEGQVDYFLEQLPGMIERLRI